MTTGALDSVASTKPEAEKSTDKTRPKKSVKAAKRKKAKSKKSAEAAKRKERTRPAKSSKAASPAAARRDAATGVVSVTDAAGPQRSTGFDVAGALMRAAVDEGIGVGGIVQW